MTPDAHDSQMIRAARPATIAREKLGEALGQIQEIPNAPDDVQDVSALIAQALGSLFAVQSSEPEEAAHVQGVRQAMASLSECLERMQDVTVRGPEIDAATGTIARTLALLYPISRVQERGPLPSEPAPAKAVPHDSRRSAQRVGMEVDVGFESETQFYTGFTQDLSEGGLFVATYDVKDIGTEIVISFTLPDGYLVSCVGVVRWLREYNDTTPDVYPGMGVQFTNLSDEDRISIEKFMADRPPLLWA